MNSFNKNKLENFYSFEKYFDGINFLPVLITLCSFKFYGYVFGFIFLIPFIYFNINKIILSLRNINFEKKLVLIYFLYLIFQSIHGAYTLKDIRIILYWVTFFSICLLIYLYNNYKLSEDIQYKKFSENLIFSSSIIYFLIYFLMNIISYIIYKNEYQIQDLFWVGGSTAFIVSSLFLFILYKKWSEINFKIYSKYSLLIILYTFMALLNESRLGQIYLILFISFSFLKGIKIKKIVNIFLIMILCFYSYSFGSNFIYFIESNINNNIAIPKPKTFLSETKSNLQNFKSIKSDQDSGDAKRLTELLIGLKAYQNSTLLEKIIGNGWYSSRITIANTRNNFIDKYKLEKNGYIKKEINHLQGIVSLLLDTGAIGIIYTSVLFLFLLRKIIICKSLFLNKFFYLALIMINFLCLFIGYPWINTVFILMILPGGIFLLEKDFI